MTDIPNDNSKNSRYGKLLLFKLQARQDPIIISNNVGTIDYQKGEILIRPINITGTSKKVQNISIIEISACPKSNDVIGLQDLYLQLDVTNSTIDIISDNIASGENTSGTNYTSSSSYIYGDIARLTIEESQNTTLTTSDTYVVGNTDRPMAPSY